MKNRIAIVTGSQARKYLGPDGKRVLYPIKVTVQVIMSPLMITGDTLVVCLYVKHPAYGVNDAAQLFKRWYDPSARLAPGYPKPHGDGTLELLLDKDFKALYRDAKREAAAGGHQIRTLGPKDDPTAFHVMRTGSRIILPG